MDTRKIRLLESIKRLIEQDLRIELTPEAHTYLDRTLLGALTRPMCNVFEIRMDGRKRRGELW